VIGIAVVEAPWGPIHLAADADGLLALEVLTTRSAFVRSIERRLGEAPARSAGSAVTRRLAAAVEGVEAHLAGRRGAVADLPYTLRGLATWDRLVLETVRRIPWGEVTSYGGIAREIGRPGAARAVGGAVGRNPIGLVIPCHRVIAGDGSLGGYGGSWLGDREVLLTVKRRLLALEDTDPLSGHVAWTTFRARSG
jgi:O-6-methylguanine DNA methyltransferase